MGNALRLAVPSVVAVGTRVAAVVGAVAAIVLSASNVSAAPLPFTWDLSKAVPALGAGGAFTADSIGMTTYLYALAPPSGDTPETFIFTVDSFKLGGTNVTPAGLGSSFGLYFTADVSVTPTNQYTKFNIALKADPGNLDGTPGATAANGASFSNTGPTGTADDITLATGTVLTGSFGLQANGRLGAHFTQTFAPSPGEVDVFLDPVGNHVQIEELLFNTATSRVQTTQGDGSVLTLVNGGISTADIRVPEPASSTLVVVGLLGLVCGLTRARAR
jgi:hypothetical protein